MVRFSPSFTLHVLSFCTEQGGAYSLELLQIYFNHCKD